MIIVFIWLLLIECCVCGPPEETRWQAGRRKALSLPEYLLWFTDTEQVFMEVALLDCS